MTAASPPDGVEPPRGRPGGRIHPSLIHVDPDVLAIPELCERAANPPGGPVGTQGRVMQQRDPDAVTLHTAIPRVRVAEVCSRKSQIAYTAARPRRGQPSRTRRILGIVHRLPPS